MNRLFKSTAIAVALTIAVSTSSFAFTQADGSAGDREACTPDVFRLCAANIPNADAIVGCLHKKRAQLSPACKKVIK